MSQSQSIRPIALITGATGGLGQEFARIFAREGYDLVLTARSENRLLELREEIRVDSKPNPPTVYIYPCDLAEDDAVEKIYGYTQEQGLTVDTLVNNAGFGDQGDFHLEDEGRMNALLQVDIVALVQLTRHYLPEMVARQKGQILNVASVAAFGAGPHMSLYYAAKAFVRSFSEAIHEEVRGSGVTVTAVCPGPVDTGYEAAAGLEGSKMFTLFRPAKPDAVAEGAYRALRRGKALYYHGFGMRLMAFGTRLASRKTARRFAGWVNVK